jgi:hypothetical protein
LGNRCLALETFYTGIQNGKHARTLNELHNLILERLHDRLLTFAENEDTRAYPYISGNRPYRLLFTH